ncbi:MAG TPA: metalloregulator ArsR/SmtB family transcription factor [Polyangiaceae bacterium]|jgi:DNA-binding transcriptional ArsR family regulator|nr:metalloregulator ArsR/SmtB family transcription factor [Polyangiaceae bacterium]
MSRHSSALPSDDQLDAVFAALGDRTRRAILLRLASGPASITELAEPFAMTLPAVSKHVRVLESAGLMRRERDGWYHRCHLEAQPLEGAVAFLARYRPFWEHTLDELAAYVEEKPKKAARKRPAPR